MKRSTHHILTTHTGSLPRPSDLVDIVLRQEAKQPVDEEVLAMRVRSAVAEVVLKQAEIGITFLNDGEQGKPDDFTYMKDRLTGFEEKVRLPPCQAKPRTFRSTARGAQEEPPPAPSVHRPHRLEKPGRGAQRH